MRVEGRAVRWSLVAVLGAGVVLAVFASRGGGEGRPVALDAPSSTSMRRGQKARPEVTRAPAPAPLPVDPPLHPRNFSPLGDEEPVLLPLHPSWCAPSRDMPYLPVGQARTFDGPTEPGMEQYFRLYVLVEADPPYRRGGSSLRVNERCELVFPRQDWGHDQPVCLVRYGAFNWCENFHDFVRMAATRPLRPLPPELLNPPCLGSTRGFGPPEPGDRDAVALTHLSVFDWPIPLPQGMPRAWCDVLVSNLDSKGTRPGATLGYLDGGAPVVAIEPSGGGAGAGGAAPAEP